jgi:hypothetical protein
VAPLLTALIEFRCDGPHEIGVGANRRHLIPDYSISDGNRFNIAIIIARGSCDARLVE